MPPSPKTSACPNAPSSTTSPGSTANSSSRPASTTTGASWPSSDTSNSTRQRPGIKFEAEVDDRARIVGRQPGEPQVVVEAEGRPVGGDDHDMHARRTRPGGGGEERLHQPAPIARVLERRE